MVSWHIKNEDMLERYISGRIPRKTHKLICFGVVPFLRSLGSLSKEDGNGNANATKHTKHGSWAKAIALYIRFTVWYTVITLHNTVTAECTKFLSRPGVHGAKFFPSFSLCCRRSYKFSLWRVCRHLRKRYINEKFYFENEIGFFLEFLLTTHHCYAYYVEINWSGWKVLINSGIIFYWTGLPVLANYSVQTLAQA